MNRYEKVQQNLIWFRNLT